jgi:mono/diheme cytochrome c family protein
MDNNTDLNRILKPSNRSTLAWIGIPVGGVALGLALFAAIPGGQPHHVKAAPSVASEVARGKYLVEFGGCHDCHTPLKMTEKGPVPDVARMFSGHPQETKLPPPDLKPGPWFAATAGMTAWAGPWGISYAANITPDVNTGIGIWTEEMFIKAMRTGKHMGDGREILPPMPWRAVAGLNDADIKAMYAYLKTVPPVANRVPEPVGPNGPSTFE